MSIIALFFSICFLDNDFLRAMLFINSFWFFHTHNNNNSQIQHTIIIIAIEPPTHQRQKSLSISIEYIKMKINKCKNCNCNFHCSLQEHSDFYGVCSCLDCKCDKSVVIDSNNECEVRQ